MHTLVRMSDCSAGVLNSSERASAMTYIALHFTRVARQTFYLFSLRGRLANGGGIGAAEDFMAATIASKFIGSRARG